MLFGNESRWQFPSNGPGDPEPCDYAIQAIKEILDTQIPCFLDFVLGHQVWR